MENEKKKKNTTSFRITFKMEDVDFMNQYKDQFGSSIQWFVERSVKEKIENFKIQQELNEKEL